MSFNRITRKLTSMYNASSGSADFTMKQSKKTCINTDVMQKDSGSPFKGCLVKKTNKKTNKQINKTKFRRRFGLKFFLTRLSSCLSVHKLLALKY